MSSLLFIQLDLKWIDYQSSTQMNRWWWLGCLQQICICSCQANDVPRKEKVLLRCSHIDLRVDGRRCWGRCLCWRLGWPMQVILFSTVVVLWSVKCCWWSIQEKTVTADVLRINSNTPSHTEATRSFAIDFNEAKISPLECRFLRILTYSSADYLLAIFWIYPWVCLHSTDYPTWANLNPTGLGNNSSENGAAQISVQTSKLTLCPGSVLDLYYLCWSLPWFLHCYGYLCQLESS